MHLQKNKPHIWMVAINSIGNKIAEYSELLSEDEQKRGQRFYFKKDQEQYVLQRGSLRCILSAYLNQAPKMIRFTYDQYGKPALASSALPLEFNVSHSGDLLLVGLALGQKVGVDIEKIKPMEQYQQIAEQVFSVQEKQALHACVADRREYLFFSIWTGKEAYIKARGQGLSYPLDAFSVGWDTEASNAFIQDKLDPQSVWGLSWLEVPTGYRAAVVSEGTLGTIRYCQMQELNTQAGQSLGCDPFYGYKPVTI